MTLLVVFASFFATLITSFLVIRYEHLHQKFSLDHDFLGIQKFHTESTPRIGGIPLFVGLAVIPFSPISIPNIFVRITVLIVGIIGFWYVSYRVPSQK